MSSSDSLRDALGDLPVTPLHIEEKAGRVQKVGEKVKTTISDVRAFLQSKKAEALDLKYPPSFEEIMRHESIVDVVTQITEITHRYNQPGSLIPGLVEEDAGRLASLVCDLGLLVGYMEGRAAHAEKSLELVQARYLLRAKEYGSTHPVSVTDMMAKALAREASADMYAFHGQFDTLWKTFRSLYFAAKDMVEYLDHMASRFTTERKIG